MRLTGRVGRTTVGVLNMQTEQEVRTGRPTLPAANFTVARVSRDFFSNSSAGLFVLDKERGDESNRVVGGEVRFNLKRALNIDGLFMVSDKTAIGSGVAWRAGVTYDPGKTATSVSYTALGNEFRDDLGFIRDRCRHPHGERHAPDAAGVVVEDRSQAGDAAATTCYRRDGIGIETQSIARHSPPSSTTRRRPSSRSSTTRSSSARHSVRRAFLQGSRSRRAATGSRPPTSPTPATTRSGRRRGRARRGIFRWRSRRRHRRRPRALQRTPGDDGVGEPRPGRGRRHLVRHDAGVTADRRVVFDAHVPQRVRAA
jgi:hypothetical protein